jgi:ATP-dependent DNA helicase RecG
MRALALGERQQRAITHLKARQRITNSEYQTIVGVSRATASRDLEELLAKGVLEKVGTTGKGTYYLLAKKRLVNDSNDS